MKINNFLLAAYGGFSERLLDFSKGNHGLHLVLGPNEAGKSTALRALKALLYGIPNRTDDDFVHEKKMMRLQAELQHGSGEVFQVTRVKKNKNSLLDAAGNPLDEAWFNAHLLNGLSEEMFSTLYGIDHDALVQGSRDLLAAEGNVGRIIFSASLGNRQVQGVLAQLEADANQIFIPQGKTQLIPTALRAYSEAEQNTRVSSLAAQRYRSHQQALEAAESEVQTLRDNKNTVINELEVLRRLQRWLPLSAKRKQTLQELEPLAEVPALPQGFAEQRRQLQWELAEQQRLMGTLTRQLEEGSTRVEALEIPQALLDHQSVIEAMAERLGSHIKAEEDRKGLAREARLMQDRCQHLLNQIQADLSLEQAQSLFFTRPEAAAVRSLIGEYHSSLIRLEEQQEKYDSLQDQLEQLQQQLPQAPDQDLSPLSRCIKQFQRHGNLPQEARDLQKHIAQLERQLETGIQRLWGWQGTPQQLESLSLPLSASLDRFDLELQELQSEQKLLQGQKKDLRAKLARVEANMDKLQSSAPLATEEELQALRDRRDQGWQLIRLMLQGLEVEPQQIYAFAQGRPIFGVFEQLVKQTDQMVDQMRRDTKRLESLALQKSEQQALLRQLQELETQQASIAQRHDMWARQFTELWQPLGLEPRSPKEMREWWRHCEELRQLAKNLTDQRQKANHLETILNDLTTALKEVLEAVSQQSYPTDWEPAQWLEAAEAFQERQREIRIAFQNTVQQLQKLQTEQQRQASRLETLSDQRQRILEQWSNLLERMGLRQDATPVEVEEVLRISSELAQLNHELQTLQTRINGIDRDAKEFQQATQNLFASLQESPPEDLVLGVRSLKGRLTEVLKQAELREQFQHRQDEMSASLEQAHQKIAHLQRQWEQLMTQVGDLKPEELSDLEVKAQRKTELLAQLEQIEESLLQDSGGDTLEEIQQRLDEVQVELLPARLQELQEEQGSLENRLTERNQVIGEHRNELNKMTGLSLASRHAEEAQAQLAALQQHSEDWLRLKTANFLLKKHIERYRKQNQPPLLTRAAELFQHLTLGGFSGLDTDQDDKGNPILFGVRDSGEYLKIPQLSDGTRDQLYLAMRLASLEQTLNKSEALPFVVDDILINFDDRRSQAALEVLSQLARSTQIIVFSHHPHLVPLAQQAVPQEELNLIQL